jgi:hypothetical protein
VLAVALALMALIAATTVSHSRSPRIRAASSSRSGAVVKHATPPSSTTTIPVVAQSPALVALLPAGALGRETGQVSMGRQTSSTTTSTTTTTTVQTASATTTTLSAGGAETGTGTYPGNLEYPDNVSASYPLSVDGGTLSASAQWTGTSVLSLRSDCPSGSASRTGPSGLSLTVAPGSGTCTVTLSEPPGTESTVSYSITINTEGS